MNVISFVSYSGSSSLGQEARDAARLVRAVKRYERSEKLTRLSRFCRLDINTPLQALEWFGKLGAFVLEKKNLPLPITLIPVPNSECSLTNDGALRTRLLAEVIAKEQIGAHVWDCLRWKRVLPPSHCGGTRDVRRLCRELVVIKTPHHSGSVVLVDDVVATGAHLRAVSYILANLGVQCDYALCLARVEHTVLLPFAIKQGWIPNRSYDSSERRGSTQ